MSKKSRKRNKILLAGAALLGASKLGMLPGSKTAGVNIDKGRGSKLGLKYRTPEKFKTAIGPTEKKTFPRLKVDSTGNVFKDGVNKGVGNTKTKFVNLDSSKGTGSGIYQGGKKVSGLNQKSINVLKDGKIQTGGKTYADKKAYSSAMKIKRGENTDGVKGFLNKFVLGEKTKLNKGKMVKARGGGMARSKPTKLY